MHSTTLSLALLLLACLTAYAVPDICDDGRDRDYKQNAKLLKIAKQLPVDISNLNWTAVEASMSVDAVGCFFLGAGADLGCFHSRDHVIGYLKVIDYHVTEMVHFYPNLTFYENSTDTVNDKVMLLVDWPVTNIQEQRYCSLIETIIVGFNCEGKINYYRAHVDAGSSAACGLPPMSDGNATRICLGGSNFGTAPYVQGIMQSCTGDNMQYETAQDCIDFISGLPVQTTPPSLAWGNSASCRDWHSKMAIQTPQIHCAHTGYAGGGKCCTGCAPTGF